MQVGDLSVDGCYCTRVVNGSDIEIAFVSPTGYVSTALCTPEGLSPVKPSGRVPKSLGVSACWYSKSGSLHVRALIGGTDDGSSIQRPLKTSALWLGCCEVAVEANYCTVRLGRRGGDLLDNPRKVVSELILEDLKAAVSYDKVLDSKCKLVSQAWESSARPAHGVSYDDAVIRGGRGSSVFRYSWNLHGRASDEDKGAGDAARLPKCSFYTGDDCYRHGCVLNSLKPKGRRAPLGWSSLSSTQYLDVLRSELSRSMKGKDFKSEAKLVAKNIVRTLSRQPNVTVLCSLVPGQCSDLCFSKSDGSVAIRTTVYDAISGEGYVLSASGGNSSRAAIAAVMDEANWCMGGDGNSYFELRGIEQII